MSEEPLVNASARPRRRQAPQPGRWYGQPIYLAVAIPGIILVLVVLNAADEDSLVRETEAWRALWNKADWSGLSNRTYGPNVISMGMHLDAFVDNRGWREKPPQLGTADVKVDDGKATATYQLPGKRRLIVEWSKGDRKWWWMDLKTDPR